MNNGTIIVDREPDVATILSPFFLVDLKTTGFFNQVNRVELSLGPIVLGPLSGYSSVLAYLLAVRRVAFA